MRALGAMLVCLATADAFLVVPSSSPCLSARTYRGYSSVAVARARCKGASRRVEGISSRVARMCVGDEFLEMEEMEEVEEDAGGALYTDVTVREAVEWTMSKDSDFYYVDVRSAEEHEKLATPRGSICVPAFERDTDASEDGGEEEDPAGEGRDRPPVYEEDYNYESMNWKVLPDFVDRMKARFELDAKLLIGCKTNRSATASQLLADAGFTDIYNVESQIFMRTRAPEVWE